MGVDSWLTGIELINLCYWPAALVRSDTTGRLSLACLSFCSFAVCGDLPVTMVGETLMLVWS